MFSLLFDLFKYSVDENISSQSGALQNVLHEFALMNEAFNIFKNLQCCISSTSRVMSFSLQGSVLVYTEHLKLPVVSMLGLKLKDLDTNPYSVSQAAQANCGPVIPCLTYLRGLLCE